jgi:hypothetical protein
VSAPPEALWTEADKNVKTVIQTGPAAVYKITGQLDPASCAKLGTKAHT